MTDQELINMVTEERPEYDQELETVDIFEGAIRQASGYCRAMDNGLFAWYEQRQNWEDGLISIKELRERYKDVLINTMYFTARIFDKLHIESDGFTEYREEVKNEK